MVVQHFFLNSLIFLIRFVRSIIVWLGLVQRLPMLILGGLVAGLGRIMYRFFGVHRPFVLGMKWVIRMAFFLRGLRVKLDGDSIQKDFKGIHLINAGDPLAMWLLFAFLPYDQLIIAPDEFFESNMFNSYLFLLGFVPQEYGVTPDTLSSFESRLAPYLSQGFGCWQPVHFEYRDIDSMPYAVVLALKFNVPITLWRLSGSTQLDRVHWLRRRCLKLQFLSSIPISKRMALTIATYQKSIRTHFGPTLNQQRLQLQNEPGMPPSPGAIATKKFEDAAKAQQELENGFRSP